MNKYLFNVSVSLSNSYEIEASNEDRAREKLDDILNKERGSLDGYDVYDSDIMLVSVVPHYNIAFDGQNLIVQTQNGKASANLCELIDSLCAKADGGDK